MVESPDVQTIYEIPLKFHEQGFDDIVLKKFGIEQPEPNLAAWRAPDSSPSETRGQRHARVLTKLA